MIKSKIQFSQQLY